jgi:hypothetical protein
LDIRSHDDHWTKCRHPETAHNTVSSYDCAVDGLELVFKLEKLEPPKIGANFRASWHKTPNWAPIQPWDVKDFSLPGLNDRYGAPGSSGAFLPPSPPAEKATARCDEPATPIEGSVASLRA